MGTMVLSSGRWEHNQFALKIDLTPSQFAYLVPAASGKQQEFHNPAEIAAIASLPDSHNLRLGENAFPRSVRDRPWGANHRVSGEIISLRDRPCEKPRKGCAGAACNHGGMLLLNLSQTPRHITALDPDNWKMVEAFPVFAEIKLVFPNGILTMALGDSREVIFGHAANGLRSRRDWINARGSDAK
jgi:hypothetical protein